MTLGRVSDGRRENVNTYEQSEYGNLIGAIRDKTGDVSKKRPTEDAAHRVSVVSCSSRRQITSVILFCIVILFVVRTSFLRPIDRLLSQCIVTRQHYVTRSLHL